MAVDRSQRTSPSTMWSCARSAAGRHHHAQRTVAVLKLPRLGACRPGRSSRQRHRRDEPHGGAVHQAAVRGGAVDRPAGGHMSAVSAVGSEYVLCSSSGGNLRRETAAGGTVQPSRRPPATRTRPTGSRCNRLLRTFSVPPRRKGPDVSAKSLIRLPVLVARLTRTSDLHHVKVNASWRNPAHRGARSLRPLVNARHLRPPRR